MKRILMSIALLCFTTALPAQDSASKAQEHVAGQVKLVKRLLKSGPDSIEAAARKIVRESRADLEFGGSLERTKVQIAALKTERVGLAARKQEAQALRQELEGALTEGAADDRVLLRESREDIAKAAATEKELDAELKLLDAKMKLLRKRQKALQRRHELRRKGASRSTGSAGRKN